MECQEQRNVYLFYSINYHKTSNCEEPNALRCDCEDAYLNIIMFKIHRNYSPQRREIDSKQYFSPPHTVWSLVYWIDLWWYSASYHTWRCRTFAESKDLNAAQIWLEWDECLVPWENILQEHCGALRRSAFTLRNKNMYRWDLCLWKFRNFKEFKI